MSIDDYNRGRMDQQIQSGDSVFSPSPRTVVEEVRNYEEERKLRQSAMDLIIALKKSNQITEEWKKYAHKLEAMVEGSQKLVLALREEISKCTSPNSHPMGLHRDAQMVVYDDAFIAKAKENNVPDSEWQDIKERVAKRSK